MQVLIVEDEALLALDLKQMLTRLGHEVVASVNNLDDAQRHIEQDAFDLAIIDINLNGNNGAELLPRLKNQERPVIVATGYDTSNVDGDLAAYPCLHKPYDVKDLRAALKKATEKTS